MNNAMLKGGWLTDAALENMAEVGIDSLSADADVQAIANGTMTRDELFETCVNGADEDRIPGWSDYVAAVCGAARYMNR